MLVTKAACPSTCIERQLLTVEFQYSQCFFRICIQRMRVLAATSQISSPQHSIRKNTSKARPNLTFCFRIRAAGQCRAGTASTLLLFPLCGLPLSQHDLGVVLASGKAVENLLQGRLSDSVGGQPQLQQRQTRRETTGEAGRATAAATNATEQRHAHHQQRGTHRTEPTLGCTISTAGWQKRRSVLNQYRKTSTSSAPVLRRIYRDRNNPQVVRSIATFDSKTAA